MRAAWAAAKLRPLFEEIPEFPRGEPWSRERLGPREVLAICDLSGEPDTEAPPEPRDVREANPGWPAFFDAVKFPGWLETASFAPLESGVLAALGEAIA